MRRPRPAPHESDPNPLDDSLKESPAALRPTVSRHALQSAHGGNVRLPLPIPTRRAASRGSAASERSPAAVARRPPTRLPNLHRWHSGGTGLSAPERTLAAPVHVANPSNSSATSGAGTCVVNRLVNISSAMSVGTSEPQSLRKLSRLKDARRATTWWSWWLRQ